MIPVVPAPEPAEFQHRVRARGQAWLFNQGIWLCDPLPVGTKLPAYWQKFTASLWSSYSGICAYLAIYFEFPLGAASTDHFVPKSVHAGQAYEWHNYRLSCLGRNRKKGVAVLRVDPFTLSPFTFEIDFLTGRIRPSPSLVPNDQAAAAHAIQELGLDKAEVRKMRLDHFDLCLSGTWTVHGLEKRSPFVWREAKRQGLLARFGVFPP